MLLRACGAARPLGRARHGPAALHAGPARAVRGRRRRAVPGRPCRRADAEPVRALQRGGAAGRDARLRRPARRGRPRHRPLRARERRTGCCASPPTRPRTRATCSPRSRRPRSPACASRSASWPSRRCASSRAAPACRWPTSATPRTSASSPGRARARSSSATPGCASGPGAIVDAAGRTVGRHRGQHLYTIGQRKGLGVGAAEAPLYVLAKDRAANTLTVGTRARARHPRRRGARRRAAPAGRRGRPGQAALPHAPARVPRGGGASDGEARGDEPAGRGGAGSRCGSPSRSTARRPARSRA